MATRSRQSLAQMASSNKKISVQSNKEELVENGEAAAATSTSPVTNETRKKSNWNAVARSLNFKVHSLGAASGSADPLGSVSENHSERLTSVSSNSIQRKGITMENILMIKRKLARWRSSRVSAMNSTGASGGDRLKAGSTSDNFRRVALANTYRLKPDDNRRFSVSRVEAAIRQSAQLFVANMADYSGLGFAQIARYMSDDVKTRVKLMEFVRYKIVVQVMAGQNGGQGLEVASRGLWDATADSLACVTFKSKNAFFVVIVCGIYCE